MKEMRERIPKEGRSVGDFWSDFENIAGDVVEVLETQSCILKKSIARKEAKGISTHKVSHSY